MGWFSRNSGAIEAIAACVTALVAIIALLGVTIQLDVADTLAREQAARDAYRGHLALATEHPRFTSPSDGCAILSSPDAGAYRAFVDHMLYSAELTLNTDAGWNSVFADRIASHSDYFCSANAPLGDTPDIATLIRDFRNTACPAKLTCQE